MGNICGGNSVVSKKQNELAPLRPKSQLRAQVLLSETEIDQIKSKWAFTGDSPKL